MKSFPAFLCGVVLTAGVCVFGYTKFLRTEPVKCQLTQQQEWAKAHSEIIDWAIKRFNYWQEIKGKAYAEVDKEINNNLFINDVPVDYPKK